MFIMTLPWKSFPFILSPFWKFVNLLHFNVFQALSTVITTVLIGTISFHACKVGKQVATPMPSVGRLRPTLDMLGDFQLMCLSRIRSVEFG
jgi:hypothetical protein